MTAVPHVNTVARALVGCLHPQENRSTARHGSEPTTLVVCELCGAITRTNGRWWSRPTFAHLLEGALEREARAPSEPGNVAAAPLLELLRGVAAVLNAPGAAEEARAIERLREAARVTLDDGLTLLEATLDAAEHAARQGGARDVAVLEQYRSTKVNVEPGAVAFVVDGPAVVELPEGTHVATPDDVERLRREGLLEREPIVHRGEAITVPSQEAAEAVTFTSKAGAK